MSKKTHQNNCAARNELKTSILRAKAYYLTRVFGWKWVERKDMDYLVEEDLRVSFYDIVQEPYKARCPLTGAAHLGTIATIRYRQVPVTISWTWWLSFRLKHLVGARTHPTIPVHVMRVDNHRSIMIGWLDRENAVVT